ncbi:hypothetical protein GGR50DRAFT_671207 [Xylaria sp. CBS 124048]|nr:hypothetical protein GGR50DRAFT_671207 [Xylaria sp. CBS 124048]
METGGVFGCPVADDTDVKNLVTRACIGMEWPKNRPANTSVRLEKIPRDPTERRGFWAHCDMHTSNVLIGKIDSFREHNSVPPVKLIDFGLARQCSEAMQRNIRDIAVVMVEIITGKFQPDLLLERTVYRDVATMATPLLPGPDGRFLFPSLNQCLRNLLILCLAVELADRPSLQDALATAERAVMGGEVELLGPDMDLETDEEIRRVVQELIYDR